MTPHLIIFDCDGTLVDSQHLIAAAMEKAFETVSLAPPPREAVLGIVGLSLPQAISRLATGASEEMIMKITDGYKGAFGALRQNPDNWEPMYEGALEAVRHLASLENVALGIATGKSRRGVDRLLKRFELTSCFATIQTADDAPSKPHPGMIERAITEVDGEAATTVMIGDTTLDMEMARNAGVTAFGVAWGYHPVEQLRAQGAQDVADDYGHLMRMLDDVFAGCHAAQ